MKRYIINNLSLPVTVYESGTPEAILIQPLERKETATIDHEVSEISRLSGIPFAMAGISISDWHLQMSPWHDDAVSRKPEVGHHADETLQFVKDQLLPELQQRYGRLPAVLGGYSLAGLFSLWSATQTDAFDAIAAASPSVWIDGWPAFAAAHPMRTKLAYLSMGREEEHVRNQSMARVGNNIRLEQRLLEQGLGKNRTTLQWNEGGHFTDMDTRTAAAFAWCLQKLVALRQES